MDLDDLIAAVIIGAGLLALLIEKPATLPPALAPFDAFRDFINSLDL